MESDEVMEPDMHLLLAQLRSAPLVSLRALKKLLPAAAPQIRNAMHLLGPLMCSEDPAIAEEAEALVEAARRPQVPVHTAGQRHFSWRGIEVEYWELEELDTDLLLGYGMWPSASMLARLFINSSVLHKPGETQHFPGFDVREKTVLEIGSGVGLAGLACRACGASLVSLTDAEDRLVESLQLHHGHHANVTVSHLDWKLDSSCDQFDTILGADILLGVAEGHIYVPGVIARRLRRCSDSRAFLLCRVRFGETIMTAVSNLIEHGLHTSILQVSRAGEPELHPISAQRLLTIDPEAYVLLVADWCFEESDESSKDDTHVLKKVTIFEAA